MVWYSKHVSLAGIYATLVTEYRQTLFEKALNPTDIADTPAKIQ